MSVGEYTGITLSVTNGIFLELWYCVHIELQGCLVHVQVNYVYNYISQYIWYICSGDTS